MQGKLLWLAHPVAVRLEKPARSLAVIAVSTLLGFLLTVQIQSVLSRPPATQEYSRDLSSITIRRLEEEQKSLKEAIARLRGQIVAQQQAATSGANTLASLNEELERQRMAAGMLATRGPGIVVTLDDSPKSVPGGEDAANYLIHDYELRDVANLLWLAGAEAVAVNNERLVVATSIYCVGSTVIVNDTRLSPPYEINAIGNPTALEDALRDPSTLKKIKSRAKLYGLQFGFAQVRDLTVPAYTGGADIKYARPAAR